MTEFEWWVILSVSLGSIICFSICFSFMLVYILTNHHKSRKENESQE